MKVITLLALTAVAMLVPACTTEIHEDAPRTSTTTTTEERSVHTPVGAATTSTTVRSY
jgi:hypothetical protein